MAERVSKLAGNSSPRSGNGSGDISYIPPKAIKNDLAHAGQAGGNSFAWANSDRGNPIGGARLPAHCWEAPIRNSQFATGIRMVPRETSPPAGQRVKVRALSLVNDPPSTASRIWRGLGRSRRPSRVRRAQSASPQRRMFHVKHQGPARRPITIAGRPPIPCVLAVLWFGFLAPP